MVLGVVFSSAACTKPNPQLDICERDTDCQGDRVCSEEGQCVAPGDADTPDAGMPDANGEDAADSGDAEDGENNYREPHCADPWVSSPGLDNETTSLQALPGSTIQLGGPQQAQDDNVIYQWRFIEFPYAESIPALEPQLITHANGTADFKAETLGRYVIEFSVEDTEGSVLCMPSTAEVQIATEDQIYVELVWDTPGKTDGNASHAPDLELHYKHPNGIWADVDPPLDIFWYVPTADWGLPGDPSDDPVMRRFVENGPGPEAIYHTKPAPLVYSVGVYSYDDKGYGPSYATVRVYLDGALADEVADIEMTQTNDFYEVLTIDAGHKTTEYLDNYYEDYLGM